MSLSASANVCVLGFAALCCKLGSCGCHGGGVCVCVCEVKVEVMPGALSEAISLDC